MNPDDPIHELIALGKTERRKLKMKMWTVVVLVVVAYAVGAMFPGAFNKVRGLAGA